jgi:pyridoxal phosphate enzyme (YggS family)
MTPSELLSRLEEVRERIARARERAGRSQSVEIVAVTKGHGADIVRVAWEAGLVDVGENRVQEALDKMAAAALPVRWHLIGHLQRNKVKHLHKFHLFHALDSARLADAIAEQAARTGHRYDVLVQVNVSGELSKGGYTPKELPREAERLASLEGLRVRGAMTMAPLGADAATLRRTFRGCREALEVLRAAGHGALDLSMGMSGDFEIAVEEGATMVRLGTILFGARGP